MLKNRILPCTCVSLIVVMLFLVCALAEEIVIFFLKPLSLIEFLNSPTDDIFNSLDSAILPAAITLGAFILYSLTVQPLLLGVKRWYILLSQNKPQPVLSIFLFFKSIKLFFKAFFYGIFSTLLTLFWGILFLLPSAVLFCAALFSLSAPSAVYIDISGMFSLPMSLSVFLFPCIFVFSAITLSVFLKRYYLVKYILAENINTPLIKAFLMSVRLSKNIKSDMFLFEASLLPFKLLNIFIFPAIYTVPYISLTRTIFSESCTQPINTVQTSTVPVSLPKSTIKFENIKKPLNESR